MSSSFSRLLIPILGAFPVGLNASTPDFVSEVKPLLEVHCVRCHQEDKVKGGLRMDNKADFFDGGSDEDFIPGDVEHSGFTRRILLRPIDEGYMPDKGRILEKEEVDTLVAWVAGGAPWPDGVTLTATEPPPVPRAPMPERAPASAAEASRMLDGVIDNMLRVENLHPMPPIEDLAFLRRASIDLIGRIPTNDEIDEFLGWPERERRQKLIDRLLADERYADRWSVFFADMLRIRSNQPGADRWLAWVHGAIREGKPYDEMVRELVASSGRPGSAPAVGFILAEQANPLELGAVTSQIFLGVQIGCAMCHDHPFDDWEQEDFYDFAAFFGKTRTVGRRDRGRAYVIEARDTSVMWPPEDKEAGRKREPVKAHYPFELVEFSEKPDYIRRLEALRAKDKEGEGDKVAAAELDDLIDAIDDQPKDPVLAEARQESRALEVEKDLYRTSELRARLADRITDPRNPFFAKAFVNRVWAELIGHGFVEPVDNFSAYNDPVHASAMDFLAQEFIASGYDMRTLIRIIAGSETYRRGGLPPAVTASERERAERYFAAAPARRMLSEALFDSITIAGHLERPKWPAGANLRTETREVRVAVGTKKVEGASAQEMPAMAAKPRMRNDGYDLESTLELDFENLQKRKSQAELMAMRQAEDERLAARERAMAMKEEDGTRTIYETRTVTRKVDDNPVFSSAMRMASPAPPAHFLRVFGQPSREGLGEFREQAPSMRQELMMLNGRLTNEAARVGPLEPMHRVLEKDQGKAVELAYREILTRLPDRHEKERALEILNSEGDPADRMADLRWALLNCNEFRYLP